MAEIAWRWSFGAALALLAGFGFLEYLDTLPVSTTDMLLLRSRQPFLVSQAVADIFHGSAPRAIQATLVLALALSLGWIVIASWGRAVTLTSLLEDFRDRTAEPRWRFRSLSGLNALRVAAALGAVVGFLAAFILSGAVSPDSDPSPGAAFLVFLTIVMMVATAWLVVNWFLSLSAVFVVAEGQDTFGALSAAVGLCRDRTGAVAAASSWFCLAHVVAFVVGSSIVAFPLAFAGVLPAGVVIGGVLLVALAYFAIVDLLYMGRLAAYVAIVERPAPAPEPVPIAALSHVGDAATAGALPEASGIDPDELILSDVPQEPE
jgi:hypothetical protein